MRASHALLAQRRSHASLADIPSRPARERHLSPLLPLACSPRRRSNEQDGAKVTQGARPLNRPQYVGINMVDKQQVRLLQVPPPRRQPPLVPEHLCVTAMPRTCPTGRRVGALAPPKALSSPSISARTPPPCARPTVPECPATPPRPANGCSLPIPSAQVGACWGDHRPPRAPW